MDRISVIRNVEQALTEFESGEADLAETERHVLTVLRTYATEFEGQRLDAYRASVAEEAEDLIVAAESRSEARERAADLLDDAELEFEIEQLD